MHNFPNGQTHFKNLSPSGVFGIAAGTICNFNRNYIPLEATKGGTL